LLGNGTVSAVERETTVLGDNGRLEATGDRYTLEADVVFKAIGQKLADDLLGDELGKLRFEKGKIMVDAGQATSMSGVWAGGDCVAGGDDLTVTAVQHGKIAALSIDRWLRES